MVTKYKSLLTFYLFITILYLVNNTYIYGENQTQEDTLFVLKTLNEPVIDGIGNDKCWNNARWQRIDQVWIPLNDNVDSADFYGRFKVMWSEETNLLYILAETVDDIWVDGYIFNTSPGAHQFDVLELFFDEDHSGGEHLFDYFDQNNNPVNYNAENAFAYHLAVDIPAQGQVVTDFIALDSDGTSWMDNKNMNYANHFDEFAVIQDNGITTWEMALIVNDSSYNTNPAGARVTLTDGKVCGLAIAYCDDDTPGNIIRQNFIGSVPANMNYLDSNDDFNDCWIRADHFGAIKLIADTVFSELKPVNTSNVFVETKIYPNPVSNQLNIELDLNTASRSVVKIVNACGSIIEEHVIYDNSFQISMKDYPAGIYFATVLCNEQVHVTSIIKSTM